MLAARAPIAVTSAALIPLDTIVPGAGTVRTVARRPARAVTVASALWTICGLPGTAPLVRRCVPVPAAGLCSAPAAAPTVTGAGYGPVASAAANLTGSGTAITAIVVTPGGLIAGPALIATIVFSGRTAIWAAAVLIINIGAECPIIIAPTRTAGGVVGSTGVAAAASVITSTGTTVAAAATGCRLPACARP